jgi:hypothetical protein
VQVTGFWRNLISACLAAAVLLGLTRLVGPAAAAAAPRKVSEAQARAILAAKPKLDAKADRILNRSAAAYKKLGSLMTQSTAGGVVTIARMKRPRYFHLLQHKPEGELVGLAISDGTTYYEYTEARRKYVQREASRLTALPLPVNARHFWVAPGGGTPLLTLNGQPHVREYAFRGVGERKVAGKPADGVAVSTLVRAADGWHTFDATRYYDRASGLLVLQISGAKQIAYKNTPNARLPTEGFVWKPIPGATRSFD